MNVMVAGFDPEVTRRLSQELRAAGHQVLGALGRHGARTFLRAVVPDLVVVPSEDTARVREWTADLGLALAFVEVDGHAPDGAAAALRASAMTIRTITPTSTATSTTTRTWPARPSTPTRTTPSTTSRRSRCSTTSASRRRPCPGSATRTRRSA
ncbi:MAG: hypothetical protein U1F43_27600 [Myxococcota bacterium]